jgi:hypothetical protein
MNIIKTGTRFCLVFVVFIIACLMGLIFAGIGGALIFGTLNTLSYFLVIRNQTRPTPLRAIITCVFLSISGYLMMHGFGLLNANDRVHHKLAFINEQLNAKGYNPQWIIISQKRGYFYNLILHWKGTAVKNSEHLKGNAIDVFVLDIDGDGTYTYSDYELMQKAGKLYDKKINRKGVVAHYFDKKNSLDKHMVHIHSL